MDTARIADLLTPYSGEASAPSANQLVSISIYINLLLKWNARTNLTGIREEEEIVRRHFGESWFGARQLLAHNAADTVIDVGSGAGFPGLVLKLYAPAIHLTLVESQNKKATFLKEAVRQLELANVQVLNARAESIATQAEVVTLRAVEKFASILPIAASLVADGGVLALFIGESQLKAAQQLVPGEWQPPLYIPGASSRVLARWQRTN